MNRPVEEFVPLFTDIMWESLCIYVCVCVCVYIYIYNIYIYINTVYNVSVYTIPP